MTNLSKIPNKQRWTGDTLKEPAVPEAVVTGGSNAGNTFEKYRR